MTECREGMEGKRHKLLLHWLSSIGVVALLVLLLVVVVVSVRACVSLFLVCVSCCSTYRI